MLYRMYLYAPRYAVCHEKDLLCIRRALKKNTEEEWRMWASAGRIQPFDTEHVIRCIEKELTDPATGECQCRAIVTYPPKPHKQVPYIFIATSYARAASVLPKLYGIVIENQLVLYDAETDRSFWNDLVNHAYIAMRRRQQQLHQEIRRQMAPVYSIRQLEMNAEGREKNCSYAVTLLKNSEKTFEERNIQFQALLENALAADEKLYRSCACYTVATDDYEITYVLEGYKKHADKIGHANQGCSTVEFLHRMGVETAFRWIKDRPDYKQEAIFDRMHLEDMERAYPNPGERLIESVNISKWEEKSKLGIRYGGFGHGGDTQYSFHAVPGEEGADRNRISVLSFTDESASFILPFVEEHYSDIYERCYSSKNLFSSQTMERIVERIKEIRNLILNDFYNSALHPYIKYFDTLAFCDLLGEDYWAISGQMDTTQFLYTYRHHIAKVQDVFILWAEAQLKAYFGDELMFNIIGP